MPNKTHPQCPWQNAQTKYLWQNVILREICIFRSSRRSLTRIKVEANQKYPNNIISATIPFACCVYCLLAVNVLTFFHFQIWFNQILKHSRWIQVLRVCRLKKYACLEILSASTHGIFQQHYNCCIFYNLRIRYSAKMLLTLT